jgi:hypothetical protein
MRTPQHDGTPILCYEPAMRDLSETDAKSLKPGSDHYTAYVGPPGQYDFMGATQFALLFALGLREHHKVLDFGCGSLRAGRLLIPYLNPGCYFGIEPNRWLVDEAIKNQIGADIVSIKRPRSRNRTPTRRKFLARRSISSSRKASSATPGPTSCARRSRALHARWLAMACASLPLSKATMTRRRAGIIRVSYRSAAR